MNSSLIIFFLEQRRRTARHFIKVEEKLQGLEGPLYRLTKDQLFNHILQLLSV
jgi:hypothetical protein